LEDSIWTQAEIESLCRRLYHELGKNPADFIQVKPCDGGWDNALSYEITRADMKRTRIYQKDLDDDDTEAVRNCLRGFS